MLTIINADCLESLREMEPESVQCVVTSPPYWGLRDYGVAGQIGLEDSPEIFVAKMVEVFRAVHRVLRKDGTLWLNLGDSYISDGGAQGLGRGAFAHDYAKSTRTKTLGKTSQHGLVAKNLAGIPWRVAFALQSDGWILRQDIVWHKPNPMPESVRDRCTKSHEYLFLFSKSKRYLFNFDAIQEPATGNAHARRRSERGRGHHWVSGWAHGKGSHSTVDRFKPNGTGRKFGKPGSRVKNNASFDAALSGLRSVRNKRSVWTIQSQPYKGAHFATFPEALVLPCILAGSSRGDTVLDPFGGAGTTAKVALANGRESIAIEINPEYCQLIRKRVDGLQLTAL